MTAISPVKKSGFLSSVLYTQTHSPARSKRDTDITILSSIYHQKSDQKRYQNIAQESPKIQFEKCHERMWTCFLIYDFSMIEWKNIYSPVNPKRRKNIFTGNHCDKKDRTPTIRHMTESINTYMVMTCVAWGMFLSSSITIESPIDMRSRLSIIRNSNQKNPKRTDPRIKMLKTIPAINVCVRKRMKTFGFFG